jgi:Mycothiol maleylpyruvate isomerase N-terminal domain
MNAPSAASDDLPVGHPYGPEIEAEREGWYALVGLVRSLDPAECLEPGYYQDWSVRHLVAHVGTWLAEAQVQFERMSSGTYEGHDVDIDGLNAKFLEAMGDQPWDVTWVQAHAARSRMLEEWHALREPSVEAAWWIRKSASEHVADHLGRLREWVAELIARRAADSVDTRPGSPEAIAR